MNTIPRYQGTPLKRIAEMNTAFGNPAGDFTNIERRIILWQSRNIFDEYLELLSALGFNSEVLGSLKAIHDNTIHPFSDKLGAMDVEEVRDALCDIQVFTGGAQHLMGVNADMDMHSVIDGVMSRFIKDEADKAATIALHAAKGVTDVYFEGEYPKMVMKSASDQPDAPKGKFLKSASYSPTKFYDFSCKLHKYFVERGYTVQAAADAVQNCKWVLESGGKFAIVMEPIPRGDGIVKMYHLEVAEEGGPQFIGFDGQFEELVKECLG